MTDGVEVVCKDCGKKHKIKPNGLGLITPNLIWWAIDMNGSCCEHSTFINKKEKAE